VDLKLQFDNRTSRPDSSILMCEKKFPLANHLFGMLTATSQGKRGFKDEQNIDSILCILSISFF
jgi:hypothetical protein